jgi:hypothetical protein
LPAQISSISMRLQKEQIASIVYVAACALFLLIGGYRALVKDKSHDFAPVYAGARCLIDGCNPYKINQLEGVLMRSGATPNDLGPWRDVMPVYPPPTLAVLLPFSVLPYPWARALWFIAGALALCAGALGAIFISGPQNRLLSTLLASLCLISSTGLVGAGQPVSLSIGLAILAIWLLLARGPYILAAVILTFSIILKFHVAGPLLIWLFLEKAYRRTAIIVAAFSIAILLLSVAILKQSPASSTWITDLRDNIALTAAPGGINDPTRSNPEAMRMTNLQTLFAMIDADPRFYERATWVTEFILVLAWVAAFLFTRPSRAQETWHPDSMWTRSFRLRVAEGPIGTISTEKTTIFCLAAIACLTLLPVYHRLHDARLLFLTVPALTCLFTHRRIVGLFAVCLTLTLFFSIAFQLQGFIQKLPLAPGEFLQLLVSLVVMRLAPLALLALTSLYVIAIFRVKADKSPTSVSVPG